MVSSYWVAEGFPTLRQKHVHSRVDVIVYKGVAHVLAESAPESNLYSEEETSMDRLDAFDVSDTTDFTAILGARLKKYGAAKIQRGEPLLAISGGPDYPDKRGEIHENLRKVQEQLLRPRISSRIIVYSAATAVAVLRP
ncbi:hypothetical protein NUW58_g589 [Xylaria curta]|uniref:Uncharacterized protein n=1 Tax=Xylaria curta TaxID=42375 RepID=A0ACC1PR96_9PEZI|nr:hypothetical protein NUW58_g589 [Xylaria curta]